MAWALEIKADPLHLAWNILGAAGDGEFDKLPDGSGLLSAAPDGWRQVGFSNSVQVKFDLAALAALARLKGFDLRRAAPLMWDIHRDAVLRFADARQLPRPSWWKNNNAAAPSRNVSEAELFCEAEKLGDGLTSSLALRKKVAAVVDPKKITDELWRGVMERLPPDKKLPRGHHMVK